jgi:hypothetical protein
MIKNLVFKGDAPLNKEDKIDSTYGCRHSNWNICKHALSNKCAFANNDKICKAPPQSWKKNFENLSKKNLEKDNK